MEFLFEGLELHRRSAFVICVDDGVFGNRPFNIRLVRFRQPSLTSCGRLWQSATLPLNSWARHGVGLALSVSGSRGIGEAMTLVGLSFGA
jgi:hypothetical protein